MSRLWLSALGVFLGWSVLTLAWAGQYRLLPGQANRVPVGIDVRNHETLCNVEIQVQGDPPFQQRVRAPDFIAWLVLTPVHAGELTVSWRGVFHRTEQDELINACPTMGSTRFRIGANHADIVADWQKQWQAMSPPMAACMQEALRLLEVATSAFDRQDPVGSPHDRAVERARQSCESLLALKTPWGPQPRIGHACTLNGRATRCDGYYTSALAGATRLDDRQAIARILQGESVRAAHAESRATIAARQRAEQAARAKAEAEEAARVEAFKLALAEQKKREQLQEQERQRQAEEERQRKIKAAEQREREYLENRPWLVRKLSRVQPKPLEEEAAPDAPAGGAASNK